MKQFFVVILFSIGSKTHAQQFSAVPPSVKWQILKTDTVDVIFPKGFYGSADVIANIAAYEQKHSSFSIGQNVKKLPIVLQPFTINSNGYVQLAPRRSEFFLTPPQSGYQLGVNGWTQNLALHEYRHIMQYNNFNTGISKSARFLLGQHGQELLNSAAIPDWFWEGDAVYYETTLSNSGRGRIPNFFNYYKSLWVAGKNYSFMKLRNGSLKDMIPSHYHLGYLLVSYGRKKYGEAFWEQVCKDAAAYKGGFYPFQKALLKHSNITYKDFRNEAFSYFKKEMQVDSLRITGNAGTTTVTGRGDVYFPQFVSDSSFIFLQSTPDRPPAFYISKNQHERLLFAADFITDNYFHHSQNKIVYSTPRTDARWSYIQYSDIRIADLTTKEAKTITHRGRYFSPSFSASAKKVVAILQSEKQENYIQVLDANSGNILFRYKLPESEFASFPRFLNDNELVFGIRNTNGKMALAQMKTGDSSHRLIIPFSPVVIGSVAVENGSIFFSASVEGADNIFELKSDGRIFQVTNEALGGYQPDVGSGRVLYTTLTWEGYKPVVQNEREKGAEIQRSRLANSIGYVPAVDLLYPKFDGQKHADTLRKTESYNRTSGLLNFHSIKPFYDDPNWSLTLLGENVLNNIQTEVFYVFNENEFSHEAGFRQAFGLFYPVVTYGSSFTMGRPSQRGNYHQLNWNAGLHVPLNFSRNKTLSTLQFGSNINFEKTFFPSKSAVGDQGAFFYLRNFLRFQVSGRSAPLYIVPRKAVAGSVQFRNALSGSAAWQLLTQLSVNVPSVFRTHAFQFSGAFQQRDTALQHLYANNFPFSRGYVLKPDYPVMYKGTANYFLPLACPDWGLAHIIYVNRIRSTLFYDYAVAKSIRQQTSRPFAATGAEVWFDTRWWNQFPLSVGFRYTRLLNEGLARENANRFEILLPVLF